MVLKPGASADAAVPPHDRLRAPVILCYTTASGNEAEEYLPGWLSASRGQCKPGGQAAGKGAVELRFLSDRIGDRRQKTEDRRT